MERMPWWGPPRTECEDCGRKLEIAPHGPQPSVCRPCQNKRYRAKVRADPLRLELRRLRASERRTVRRIGELGARLAATRERIASLSRELRARPRSA